jgi:uncharacterized protein YjdB
MKQQLLFKLIFSFLLILIGANFYSQQLAFPCAKGSGAFTTGGRGGQVIHVTTLNWTGPGSLKAAIQTTGPRTIVFDVSGEIDATSENAYVPIINGATFNDVTIAGQTAPNGGITVRTSEFMFQNVDNIIIRYVRFRQDTSSNQDAIWMLNCSNSIFDHCTFSHGGDESASWSGSSGTSGSITVQNSFFQDSKTGSILGVDNIAGDFTFVDNAYSGVSHRFPNPKGDGHYDIVNNVIYNWKYRLIRITGEGTYNVINNYYKPSLNGLRLPGWFGNGVIGTFLQKLQTQAADNPLIYTSGSIVTGQRDTALLDDSDMWTIFAGSHLNENDPVPAQYFTSTQFPLAGEIFTLKTANQAYIDVLNNVGAHQTLNADGTINSYRDTKDAADILMIQNDTYSGSFYDARSTIPYPVVPTNTRPGSYDTDNDGMADLWETNTFGDLSRTGTLDFDNDGYTDLEEFLNEVDVTCNIGGVTIAVTGVSLLPQVDTINIPATLQVVKTIAPLNATDQTGVWLSSNPSVATVNGGGLVTPVAVGNTTIYFTTTDGSFIDSSLITVTNIVISATGVSVSPSLSTISVSQTLQLTKNFTPANTTDQTGVWASSNSAIASVNASGLVTGATTGTATITFTSTDGGYTGSSVITVVSSPELYVESSAASIPNETNSIGSWTYDNTPVVSSESQTGSYSIAYTTANNYEEIRYEGLVLTNGVNYELKLLIKGTDNSAYSYIRGGVSSYDNGINTSFVVRSSHYGAADSTWQMHTWQLVGNGTPLKVALGYASVSVANTFYLDEMSLKELNTTKIDFIKGDEYFNIYPNPTTNQLTIDIEDNIEQVTIIDSKGSEFTVLVVSNTINVSKLAKGFYALRVRTKSKLFNSSFIKK